MTVLGALASRFEPPSIQNLTTWGDWDSQGRETWSGNHVSNKTALQLLTVYGCVRFIADGISTLPVDVHRRRPDGTSEPVPTPPILDEPAPGIDFTAWATQVLSSLLIAGNAYVLFVRNGVKLPYMIPLDPNKVTVDRVDGRKVFIVEGETFSTFQVGHIPGAMWAGSDVGMSPLEAARQTIGQGMAAQEYGARFFGQGATLSGVIETPGELTEPKARQLARSFARRHGGASKAHLPGVLENGAQWKQIGVTQEQAQFLETRKFSASEIAAEMFLIDPSDMGLPVDGTSLTYANLAERNARRVQVTFLPWITRLERFCSGVLPADQYMKLNVNGLLRGDMKTRFESYALGIRSQIMVPNEAREFEDWAPLEGGDVVQPYNPGRVQAREVERDVHGRIFRVVDK